MARPTTASELIGKHQLTATACCSGGVPAATKLAKNICPGPYTTLTHSNCGVTLRYPKPASIGPDRLANARAALKEFGGPVLVVDFGTAVTFDIVDDSGAYVGGVIAPRPLGYDELPSRENCSAPGYRTKGSRLGHW